MWEKSSDRIFQLLQQRDFSPIVVQSFFFFLLFFIRFSSRGNAQTRDTETVRITIDLDGMVCRYRLAAINSGRRLTDRMHLTLRVKSERALGVAVTFSRATMFSSARCPYLVVESV